MNLANLEVTGGGGGKRCVGGSLRRNGWQEELEDQPRPASLRLRGVESSVKFAGERPLLHTCPDVGYPALFSASALVLLAFRTSGPYNFYALILNCVDSIEAQLAKKARPASVRELDATDD